MHLWIRVDRRWNFDHFVRFRMLPIDKCPANPSDTAPAAYRQKLSVDQFQKFRSAQQR